MSDPGEIKEVSRTDEENDSRHEDEVDLARQSSNKRKRSKKRQNSGGPQASAQSGQVPEERREEDESGGKIFPAQADDRKQEPLPTEDYQAQFYEHYRDVAAEYDKEFLKKHDEDLTTTLIFAGLFSAVTSAFIIQVDSQLQPDPAGETAALLRVLIYKIDNTTFGSDVPTLPQWTGPPRTLVHVQAILFASLAAALFSAFLAMLGKQWLNRYESADMRGTAIERSQNRQRKRDGIDAWYFDTVMESLPLMLQASLLLLGCALSLYLWGIDSIIASVVLGITSIGVAVYLFIIIAGSAIESCPYQTPGSKFLRYLGPKFRKALKTTFVETIKTTENTIQRYYPWRSRANIMPLLRDLIFKVPFFIVVDVLQTGILALATIHARVYHRFRPHNRSRGPSPPPEQRSSRQTAVLDSRCISWTLQTSLNKAIHLSALKHFFSLLGLAEFHPTLVGDCFNIFVGAITVSNGRAEISQELGQLATVSAGCLFRAFHRLTVMNPTSSVLRDIRRRYREVFRGNINFTDLPFRHIITMIDGLIGRSGNPQPIWREDYRLSNHEHIPFAQDTAELAQAEYQRRGKVPKWILGFASHSLSLDPLPPVSIVADCLKIIAIDLGCHVPDIMTPDMSAQAELISSLITLKLKYMGEAGSSPSIRVKHEVISSLLPYAIFLEQHNQQGMANALMHVIQASEIRHFMSSIQSFITILFGKPASPLRNWIIVLGSPHLYWRDRVHGEHTVVQWAAAASMVPDTEEVGQSVVNTLLQIAKIDFLRPHIPAEIWAQIRKPQSLSFKKWERRSGTTPGAVCHVRELGDFEILKSYFLLVWSWAYHPCVDSLNEMEISVREAFCGIGMWGHREDLIKQLDEVIEDFVPMLRLGNEWVDAQQQYKKLKEVLLDMDKEAVEILAQSHSTSVCALPLQCL